MYTALAGFGAIQFLQFQESEPTWLFGRQDLLMQGLNNCSSIVIRVVLLMLMISAHSFLWKIYKILQAISRNSAAHRGKSIQIM